MNIKNYKQALYLLLAGESIIPEKKKKKLRATMAMSLAGLISEVLKTSVIVISRPEAEDPIKLF